MKPLWLAPRGGDPRQVCGSKWGGGIPTGDERRGLNDHGFPKTNNTLQAVPRLPPAGCVTLGTGLYLTLCALVSYLYNGDNSKSTYHWWLRIKQKNTYK